MRSARIAAFVALVSAIAAGAAPAAQENVNQASLSGRVTDPQGSVVRDALVIVRQLDTNLTAQARCDRDGRFRFPYMRVGPYEVIVRSQGFADASRRVTLTVGSAFDIAVQLSLAEVSASVTVQAEAPILETTRSQIAAT
ncbi:MAG TPA: carboxypeptidase-like regulatory domain-containing protein, partial [Vicinamibacterales bacterium]|nr:carboxypeptidase-like regulatory domain-containing protein [Vicinamibacterales bacterium]